MIYYLPVLYTIKTRYSSNFKKLVYILTYILPEALILYLECKEHLPLSIIIPIFLISILSYINIYELGYIYNDTETIKNENNPTKRLSDSQLEIYEKYKIVIYFIRFMQIGILNTVLSFFISPKSIVCFCTIEIITLIIYWIYNHVRGNLAMFFYFFLISARYLSITLCATELFTLSIFIATLFVFPIVRTMEYKAHYGEESSVNLFFRKYIIKYDIQKIPVFRVWATFILLIISFILKLFNICDFTPFILCLYMFLYRFSLWFAVRLGANFKGYLKR